VEPSQIKQTLPRLIQLRRLYYWWSAAMVAALVVAFALPEWSALAFIVAALALLGVFWALVQLGRVACPRCGYRLRAIDALCWRRCRQCSQGLVIGAA
jgi:high-affinity nickel permease